MASKPKSVEAISAAPAETSNERSEPVSAPAEAVSAVSPPDEPTVAQPTVAQPTAAPAAGVAQRIQDEAKTTMDTTMAPVIAGAEKLQAEFKATTEKTLAPVMAGVAKTQAEVQANMEKAMKTAEEFVTFSQGNLEAFVKSGQIWAAGMQDITKQVAATAQAQMDHTVATFKALAGVKSLKEAVDLQTTLARASMEKAVAETGKLTDASMKLAEQAIAPLTARVTLAVEKFGRTA